MSQLRKEQLNILTSQWATYTYTATAGTTSTTLPGGFQATTTTQTSGGNPSTNTRGIITTSSYNLVNLKYQSSGLLIEDTGTQIFGRLTYSAGSGLYTVTYYKLVAGSEVSATLPDTGTYSITMMFSEVVRFSEMSTAGPIIYGVNPDRSVGSSNAGSVLVPVTAGETIIVGQPLYITNVSGSPRVFKAEADNASVLYVVGIAYDAGSITNTIRMQIAGEISIADSIWDSVPTTIDVGKPAYLSTTAGKLTLTAPSSVGSSVQKCGIITKGGSGLVKMVVQIGDVVTY